jgi:hypothetical protein
MLLYFEPGFLMPDKFGKALLPALVAAIVMIVSPFSWLPFPFAWAR